MIEAKNLTKRYGDRIAVNDLTFTVEPGRVTGFLGPNGAGKSTTMRLLLGLDRPNAGDATINGRHYRDLARPLQVVGALLEARAIHTGRSAYNHLLCLAQTQGVRKRRVDEVIELVGLTEVARKRAGGFSLGMGQRLGIAVALLGDPAVLILDEPVNGLDPEGIVWIRTLMKRLASEGRTVFVSSHLMNEMAVTADHLIVIGRGKLIADCSHRGVHRAQHGAGRDRAQPRRRARSPRRSARRAARSSRPATGLLTRHEHRGRAHRRAVRRRRVRPARADAEARLAGRGIHGADAGQRRVRQRPAPACPPSATPQGGDR